MTINDDGTVDEYNKDALKVTFNQEGYKTMAESILARMPKPAPPKVVPATVDDSVHYKNNDYLRISLRWYRCSGELVPRGAEAWYRSYRSDGTGTKRPLHTLSEGAMQTVLQGTLN